MSITAAYIFGSILTFMLIWAWSWYGLTLAAEELTETESGAISFIISLIATVLIFLLV